MANKISLIFEAIGADKLAQVFGQVASGAEKAGASAEKAAKGTESAGQAAGAATKNVDLLGLSLGKMSGLAGQAGVDLSVFQKAVQGAHESMGMLAGGFSAGTVAAGTFVTGIAAMTGVLVAASQHLVSSYNEIKTFSAISGMAAGDADDLADAMGAVGVSSQQLSMALFKLEDDASSGGEALLKLGISMDDLKTKSSGELFVSVIDKIQALGSQSEKTAALVEIFGARLGRAFAELVREGGMSIDQLKAKVADLSPWTKEMETNARNLAVAQEFLRNAIGGVVDMLGNAFAPILTTAINAMTTWVVELRKGVESSGVLGTAINMLVDVFASLWEAIAPLMPLLKEIGLAAVQVGLAMIAAFQGVMIPVVALTGAIGALWAAIQKAASGDFAGALTALKTGLAETEAAVGRQIGRFNEQVLANEKLSDSLSGVSTSWDDLASYTTVAGAAADKAAPSLRTVGDEAKKAAEAAKTAAEAFASAGQKLAGIAASFQSADVQQLAKVRNEFDDIARKVELLGPKFAGLGQQIRAMGDAAVELTRGQQAIKAFYDEVKRGEAITTVFDNLQKSIDAVHMTDAEKELAAFSAQLEKIGISGPEAQAGLLATASGLIATRDAAASAKKELQDAAKYMEDLETAATTAKVPLSNLGGSLKDVTDDAANAVVQLAILTDNAKVLIPPRTVESVVQFGDAMRELKPTAADAAVTLDILNDRVSESGAASIKAEQQWQKFGDGLKGMFDSVGDTFGKITTGLIQGTLDIDEAFKNLGQSLLVNFAQTVFDAILDEAQAFVDDFIDTIVEGLQNFDWGGFFSDLFSFIGGFFSGSGGGGGGGGGDWWDDLDFYAHGGPVRRTGPAILHQGETVVPAGFGGGWRSPGFSGMPRSGGGGGVVPVRVENVDAFGQQFGTWAGRVISAAPLAMQVGGMVLGSPALSGAGAGLGITGALATGYNMFTNAPNIPGAWAPGISADAMGPFNTGWSAQNMASIASGAGSVMSLVGGLTGIKGLSYAGMGIQGAVLATQIVSALVPQVATAITGAGATIAGSIGGSVGAWAGGAVSGLAGLPSLATTFGPAAVMAIPALASFFATMGMEEQTRQDTVRRETGQVYGGDMAARAATIQTMADLDKKYQDKVFGERTARQDVTMLATWASTFAEQANQSILAMERYAQENAANVDDLIAMDRGNMDYFNAFVAKAAQIGVTPDMALLNVSPHTVSPGHGVQPAENMRAMMDLWTEIINRLLSGTQAVAESTGDVADSNQAVASTASAVVRNQADLIIKYGGTVEALRQISEGLDLGIDIPDIMKLTKEQLDFLGTATGAQIEDMIKGWKNQITDAIVKDPVKLTGLLDMSKFQRAGETMEQTTTRVAMSLAGLGNMMKGLDQEIAALSGDGLTTMTVAFQDSMTVLGEGLDAAGKKFYESAIRIDESGKLIGDPTAMLEAAQLAHDLIIERYNAIKALEQAINQSVAQFYGEAERLVSLAPVLATVGVNIGIVAEAMSGLITSMPTLAAEMTALGSSINMFGQIAATAGATADPAMIQSAVTTWANINAGFADAAKKIMEIEDPAERMAAINTLIGQMGTAAQNAAAGLQALVAHIDALVSSVVRGAEGLARHAPLLAQVGVDLGGAASGMAKFATSLATWSGTQAAMGGAVTLGIGAIQAGQPVDAQAFVDMFATGVQKALAITDPGQRTDALTAILDQIGVVLAALPPETREAIIAAFGPGIAFIGNAVITSGTQAAEAAKRASDQLVAIIGPSGALNPQNFMAMMIGSINTTLRTIMEGGYTLFEGLVSGLTTAGGAMMSAITFAGNALTTALGEFKSANEMLRTELQLLDDAIGTAVGNSVRAVLEDLLTAQHGTGPMGVPGSGRVLAMVHGGEIIATPEQSAAIRAGAGVYAAGGYMPVTAAESGGGTITVTVAPVLHFTGVSRADAEQIAQTVITRMTDSAKTGELGVIIERRARGRV